MADMPTRAQELALVRTYRNDGRFSNEDALTCASLTGFTATNVRAGGLFLSTFGAMFVQVVIQRDEERAGRLEAEASALDLRGLSSYDLSLQDKAKQRKAQAAEIREGSA